ncbi:MFS general substrate transporter [Dothidotthia symphoricarpi CBS 119687]|uniref:MFS general substrate transporter n=1 Tax=Dothidotthia symphoricarpi CBS 119687 TaxID=1392245 RepID=A0A6A6ANG0_9PLEO|nr:MFS general substrate transporter [Dothidotthia symphoricarpi CBS 119687]KAF2132427.1 MFS general substrate transporter [Dothidotthia symphoricarpi CBS 119687]
MLARFTDSLAASSIHAYMYFQLKHFSPDAPAAIIATQCGVLVGCKTSAHVCTGLVWGRLADQVLTSRKVVLVFGLLASSLATIGYGFSTTFRQAVAWQMLDGALNATVAMVRCMTAELNPEKESRVRAFTLLPLFANIGSLLGPLIGGFLTYANSKRSIVPGYPYAMPNVCIATNQALVAITAMLRLTDTFHRSVTDHNNSFEPPEATSERTSDEDVDETTALLQESPSSSHLVKSQNASSQHEHLPFTEIWTSNVVRTMFAQFIISGHLGTFATLWAMLLSLPVAAAKLQHLPFQFSGGLGLQPHTVGIAMSAFGFTGIVLQVLVYPSLQERWGTIKVWRAALCLFPVVYFVAPFCAFVPGLKKDMSGTVSGAYTIVEWFTLLSVLLLFAAGRTGVVPATSLLINDCTPHSSVRGTIHTTGVICSNLSKSIFPPMALAVMGFGLRIGVVGLGFWFVAVLAVLSILASLRVHEGRNGR